MFQRMLPTDLWHLLSSFGSTDTKFNPKIYKTRTFKQQKPPLLSLSNFRRFQLYHRWLIRQIWKYQILQTVEFINKFFIKQSIHRYFQISSPNRQSIYMASLQTYPYNRLKNRSYLGL